MQAHATALADAIQAALPAWVERCVARLLETNGREADAALVAATAAAGLRARGEVAPQVRALLEADIDSQPTTPLSLLRKAVAYPTEVLRGAGVPPADRDPDQARLFPDDPYDLTPATLADVSRELADLGLAWGAAKAYTHIQRHGGGRTVVAG